MVRWTQLRLTNNKLTQNFNSATLRNTFNWTFKFKMLVIIFQTLCEEWKITVLFIDGWFSVDVAPLV